MHLSVYEQSEIFYFAFVFGIFLGVYYDFYRLLRYLGFTSRLAVLIQDLSFMTTSAVLCFLFAQVTVNGHLRGFVIIGHLIGLFAYRYSLGMLSGFVFSIIRFVLNLFKKAVGSLLKHFSRATQVCLAKMSQIYSKFLSFLTSKSKKIKKSEIN